MRRGPGDERAKKRRPGDEGKHVNDRHPDESEGNGAAVPRDLPDQHARPGDDPLDVDIEGLRSSDDPDAPDDQDDPDRSGDGDGADDPDSSADPDRSLPDTDEAGAGRRGSPNTGGVHPGHPVPDEPSG